MLEKKSQETIDKNAEFQNENKEVIAYIDDKIAHIDNKIKIKIIDGVLKKIPNAFRFLLILIIILSFRKEIVDMFIWFGATTAIWWQSLRIEWQTTLFAVIFGFLGAIIIAFLSIYIDRKFFRKIKNEN